jgi:hypothetical protein
MTQVPPLTQPNEVSLRLERISDNIGRLIKEENGNHYEVEVFIFTDEQANELEKIRDSVIKKLREEFVRSGAGSPVLGWNF